MEVRLPVSRTRNRAENRQWCARLRVLEYFLFDPVYEGSQHEGRLQGFCLWGDRSATMGPWGRRGARVAALEAMLPSSSACRAAIPPRRPDRACTSGSGDEFGIALVVRPELRLRSVQARPRPPKSIVTTHLVTASLPYANPSPPSPNVSYRIASVRLHRRGFFLTEPLSL